MRQLKNCPNIWFFQRLISILLVNFSWSVSTQIWSFGIFWTLELLALGYDLSMSWLIDWFSQLCPLYRCNCIFLTQSWFLPCLFLCLKTLRRYLKILKLMPSYLQSPRALCMIPEKNDQHYVLLALNWGVCLSSRLSRKGNHRKCAHGKVLLSEYPSLMYNSQSSRKTMVLLHLSTFIFGHHLKLDKKKFANPPLLMKLCPQENLIPLLMLLYWRQKIDK